MKIEPRHDKTNKMICPPSEDSDQPGYPPSLIRGSAVRLKQNWVLSYPLSAQRGLIKLFFLANGRWCAVTVPLFDFVNDDCAVGSAFWAKRGIISVVHNSNTKEKKFSELTESTAMGFSMVCVMLQAVYTTAVAGCIYYIRKSNSDYCIFNF